MKDFSSEEFLNKCCNDLLLRSEVRFAGIVNGMGRQVSGGYNKGITPLVDEEQHKMCMGQALELSMSKDLDAPLGLTEYIISKRKKVILISIPFDGCLFLISAEPNANPDLIINQINQYLKEYLVIS